MALLFTIYLTVFAEVSRSTPTTEVIESMITTWAKCLSICVINAMAKADATDREKEADC